MVGVIIHQRSDLYQENGKLIFFPSYFLVVQLLQYKVFNVDFCNLIIHDRVYTFQKFTEGNTQRITKIKLKRAADKKLLSSDSHEARVLPCDV